jgi:hypothetical protein
MYAYFEHGFSLQLTRDQAESTFHQGDCLNEVRELLKNKNIERQLNKIDPEDIRRELKSTGGWESEELTDNEANRERILWIAAGNIVEEIKEKKRR